MKGGAGFYSRRNEDVFPAFSAWTINSLERDKIQESIDGVDVMLQIRTSIDVCLLPNILLSCLLAAQALSQPRNLEPSCDLWDKTPLRPSSWI